MLKLYWRWLLAGLGFLALIYAFMWNTGSPKTSDSASKPLSPLPALSADLTRTTVSGISSGAYMAGQFQIAHASMVTGAAIIAGGPYGCAESVFSGAVPGPGAVILSASRAVNGCMLNSLTLWGVPNPKRLAEKARKLADQNSIDPIEDVANDRIYLFSGSKDRTVKPPIVEAAEQFYLNINVKPENIRFKKDIGAGHGFITMSNGRECATSRQPFVNDCDYDQAGAILNHLYDNLAPPSENLTGSFIEFDQRELPLKDRPHGLAKTGVVYVPADCARTAACAVHIAFHGCSQNRAAVGSAFVKDTGFARWADANRIILLFPQVTTGTLNPTGCWDWWGYTGKDYLTRTAPQISAVRAMLDRLAATPSSEKPPGT